MKRLIVAASAVALLAAAGAANAQTSPRHGYYNSQGRFIERNVRMPTESLPNADLKYGPYPEYPQSPPGGGY
jgi:hypothetical protein